MKHYKITEDQELIYSWVVLGTSFLITKDASSSLLNGITAYGLIRLYNSYGTEDKIHQCNLHHEDVELRKSRRYPSGC